MIDNKKGNEKTKIEEIIEEANINFIRFIESEETGDKLMLEFFREKYVHFIVYSLFKRSGFDIISEYPTKSKIKRRGKTSRSGDHDLVLFDKTGNPTVAFEFFLGYDVDEKRGDRFKKSGLTFEKFKKHLYEDYEKLENSDIGEVYLLNYFYKGKSERSSQGRKDKKNERYREHFSKCLSACSELVKKHKDSGSNIKLGIWVVEARDDGVVGQGMKRIS